MHSRNSRANHQVGRDTINADCPVDGTRHGPGKIRADGRARRKFGAAAAVAIGGVVGLFSNPFTASATTTTTYFFDPSFTPTNDAGQGSGGAGAWNTTGTNTDWTTNGTSDVAWANSSTGTLTLAVFSGGTDGASDAYPVTLTSGVTAYSMIFSNSGYQLTATNAETVTLSGGTGTLSGSTYLVPAAIYFGTFSGGAASPTTGLTESIGNDITVNMGNSTTQGAEAELSAGTLNIESGAIITKTTISTTRQLVLDGNGTSTSNGIFNVSGTISYNNNAGTTAFAVGQGAGAADTSYTTVNVNSGGVVSTNSLGSGTGTYAGGGAATGPLGSLVLSNNGSTSVLNIASNATVTISATGADSGLNLARGVPSFTSGSTGTVNLNGGTLTTPAVFKGVIGNNGGSGGSTGVFNFNGGTLKANVANTNFMSGLTTANVRAGTSTIDNGGFAITVAQSLIHTTVPADSGLTTDGGLTFADSGSPAAATTLVGSNTYNGPTTVSSGTLAVGSTTLAASATVLANTSGVSVANTAFLHLISANSTFGNTVAPVNTSATISVAGAPASQIQLDLGGGIQTVAGLTLGGTALAPGYYGASTFFSNINNTTPFVDANSSYDGYFDNSFLGAVDVTPEPSTLGLLAFGGIALMRRRRRSGIAPHP